jgi:hypothetical protein
MSQINVNNIYDGNGTDSAKLYGVSMRYGGTNFVNRIINGGMVIDQRNNGASVPLTGGVFAVDRTQTQFSTITGTTQRSTSAPAGFTNSLLVSVTTGATITSGFLARAFQVIEGFNVADLAWGTASAQTITLSFWVRSSLTGTFAGGVYNAAGTRSYIFTYAVSAANTWEYKTITIAGDTSGAWATDNTAGMYVNWDLGTGSTYQGTAGSWAAGAVWATSGSVKLAETSGATWAITGVQLEAGSVATPFERRPYGTELALCQRYYEVYTLKDYSLIGQCYSTSDVLAVLRFSVEKRAVPTATLPAAGSGANQMFFSNSALQTPATIGTHTAGEFSVSKLSINGTGYTSAFTAGNASTLYVSGNPNIQISAEL